MKTILSAVRFVVTGWLGLRCARSMSGLFGARLRCGLPKRHPSWHRDPTGTEWLPMGHDGARMPELQIPTHPDPTVRD